MARLKIANRRARKRTKTPLIRPLRGADRRLQTTCNFVLPRWSDLCETCSFPKNLDPGLGAKSLLSAFPPLSDLTLQDRSREKGIQQT
jgi:hypothetical protein